MEDPGLTEGPGEVGDRYWRELCDLVAMGEISRSDARLVAADLFEGDPAVRPVLKQGVWRRCIDNEVALAEIEDLRRNAGRSGGTDRSPRLPRASSR